MLGSDNRMVLLVSRNTKHFDQFSCFKYFIVSILPFKNNLYLRYLQFLSKTCQSYFLFYKKYFQLPVTYILNKP